MKKESTDFLTASGRKFLEKELVRLNLELKEILSIPKNTSRDEVSNMEISHQQNAIILQNAILECEKKLMLPTKRVWEQNNKVFFGNGVEVLLNQTPYYLVIDGVCVRRHKLPKNHAVVGSNTPLGVALTGKKVGQEGSYKAGDQTINFVIKKIHLPSKSKWIFKYDDPLKNIKQVPETENAYVNA